MVRGASDVTVGMATATTTTTTTTTVNRAHVWDHAGGQLIFQETGMKITEAYGNPFGFGEGRTLQSNYALVAASAVLHGRVLGIVKQVAVD